MPRGWTSHPIPKSIQNKDVGMYVFPPNFLMSWLFVLLKREKEKKRTFNGRTRTFFSCIEGGRLFLRRKNGKC
jgi:hypothetical protein